METMQPTLKNGRNVWDPVNLPGTEFQERVRALTERMQQQGLDVLLAYGYAYDYYGNATYLSNFIPDLTRGTLVAVTREGNVTLFFEGSPRGLPSAKTTTWVEDVRACPDISREAARYLEENHFVSSTIGFAGIYQWMPQSQLGFFLDFLGKSRIVDVESMIHDMRKVKSWREQDQIRRSSRVVRRVFDSLAGASFAGLNEKSVEASLIREARMEGAEDVRVLFGTPLDKPWALRPSEQASFDSGKSVIIHVAVEFERYWSEASRTFVTHGSSFVSPRLESAEGLYERMRGHILPGKTAKRCHGDFIVEMEKSFTDLIPDYDLGYGIGLAPQEPPWIREDDPGAIEKGMCLALRMVAKDPELGAVMIGDTFTVTDQGLECLTR